MDEHAWLAERFEEHRTRLRAVAYRMLGSLAEADEAVQDAWLRVSRLGAGEIDVGGSFGPLASTWPLQALSTPSDHPQHIALPHKNMRSSAWCGCPNAL
jgi:hypothetical protein